MASPRALAAACGFGFSPAGRTESGLTTKKSLPVSRAYCDARMGDAFGRARATAAIGGAGSAYLKSKESVGSSVLQVCESIRARYGLVSPKKKA